MSSELGALLVVQRLCVPCLADKTGVGTGVVEARVDRLASLILVRRVETACDACRSVTMTYGVQ